MSASLLGDAFAHHVWATVRLMDACLELTEDQLTSVVPGTFGSILATQRHLVGSDASYLFVIGGGKSPLIDEENMSLPELRESMQGHESAWSRLLAQDLDPAAPVVRHRDDGSESHAPLGIRLAQALHHGSDHRSQICTVLTTLGIEPPAIDVWDFGEHEGRVTFIPAPARFAIVGGVADSAWIGLRVVGRWRGRGLEGVLFSPGDAESFVRTG